MLKRIARILRLTSAVPAPKRYSVGVMGMGVALSLTWAFWAWTPWLSRSPYAICFLVSALVVVYVGWGPASITALGSILLTDFYFVDPRLGISSTIPFRLGIIVTTMMLAIVLRRAFEANAKAVKGLEEAVRARDEFFSMAAHELRTPLTGLRLTLDLLERKLLTIQAACPDLPPDLLTKLRRQVDRMITLVTSLLDVTKIQHHKMEYDFVSFMFCEMVRDVVERMRPEAKKVKVEVELAFEKEGFFGVWDRVRMEQVLGNLLSNALKYGRKGNKIIIFVTGDDLKCVVSVTDFGQGIPTDQLDSIFLRYNRGAQTANHSGLGIGLWVAKQIIDAHGGILSVTSVVGQGSTFKVVVPRIHPTDLIAAVNP